MSYCIYTTHVYLYNNTTGYLDKFVDCCNESYSFQKLCLVIQNDALECILAYADIDKLV